MPQNQHTLQLSESELNQLRSLLRKGKHSSRTISRARALLLSHEGKIKKDIATELGIGESTVQRIRNSYRKHGIDSALSELPRSGRPKKLDEKTGAHLIAIACSDAPNGRDHWTLELLQKRMIIDKKIKTISTVSLWRYLKERGIKPWLKKNVVYSESYA